MRTLASLSLGIYIYDYLNAVDDDELFSPDDTRLLHLGTIHIKMFRVETTRVPDCDRLGLSWTGMGPVHERSKKAGAHQIACVVTRNYELSYTNAQIDAYKQSRGC